MFLCVFVCIIVLLYGEGFLQKKELIFNFMEWIISLLFYEEYLEGGGM